MTLCLFVFWEEARFEHYPSQGKLLLTYFLYITIKNLSEQDKISNVCKVKFEFFKKERKGTFSNTQKKPNDYWSGYEVQIKTH